MRRLAGDLEVERCCAPSRWSGIGHGRSAGRADDAVGTSSATRGPSRAAFADLHRRAVISGHERRCVSRRSGTLLHQLNAVSEAGEPLRLPRQSLDLDRAAGDGPPARDRTRRSARARRSASDGITTPPGTTLFLAKTRDQTEPIGRASVSACEWCSLSVVAEDAPRAGAVADGKLCHWWGLGLGLQPLSGVEAAAVGDQGRAPGYFFLDPRFAIRQCILHRPSATALFRHRSPLFVVAAHQLSEGCGGSPIVNPPHGVDSTFVTSFPQRGLRSGSSLGMTNERERVDSARANTFAQIGSLIGGRRSMCTAWHRLCGDGSLAGRVGAWGLRSATPLKEMEQSGSGRSPVVRRHREPVGWRRQNGPMTHCDGLQIHQFRDGLPHPLRRFLDLPVAEMSVP